MVRLDEGTYQLLEDLKVKLTMRDKLPYFSYEIIRMGLQLLKQQLSKNFDISIIKELIEKSKEEEERKKVEKNE
jgi:hypothetical protein